MNCPKQQHRPNRAKKNGQHCGEQLGGAEEQEAAAAVNGVKESMGFSRKVLFGVTLQGYIER
ncbi:GL22273 [Drosophila persimilis]|uniref:GL22273 n=1 Tax=Drosophila persimilis TaxID=7234 RepID=B4GFT7_DROPE|nr:GL22273 [Drosophila persimilis]